jgi:hypothetical protein
MNETAYFLYVDSALRASGTNSNFTFQTVQNNTIQSRAKISLQSLTFVNSIYQINSTNNVLNFTVVTAGPTTNNYTMTVSPGNYTIAELVGVLRNGMNNLTVSNNTSLPAVSVSLYTNKLSWRKYTPAEANALPGEVAATYNLLSTSTIKGILGFESTFSFTNAFSEMPNMFNIRPIDYIYLTTPNIQSSSFAPTVGGNGILARIRILSSRGLVQTIDIENMIENLFNCSYIPTQWNFGLVDKYGQSVEMLLPFSFTLRIIPEN